MTSKQKTRAAARGERRVFSPEFKAEAVALLAERRALGVSTAQVGRELEVRAEQLRAWAREQGQTAGAGAARGAESPDQELRRLRRENVVLRQERAFAKKVAAYFAKESR